MRLLKRSMLAAIFAAGAAHFCPAQETTEQPQQLPQIQPLQPLDRPAPTAQELSEHAQRMARAMAEASEIRRAQPLEALEMLERALEDETPAPSFEGDDLALVQAGYQLCGTTARIHLEAGFAAEFGGHWEKAAEHYASAWQAIAEPAEKAKEAYKRFAEGYEMIKKQRQDLMDENADEIRELRAKGEVEYTNDDWTREENIRIWEGDIEKSQAAIDYFADLSGRVDRDLPYYDPEKNERALHMLEQITDQQDQIDKYPGGRGDKAKWVEGIVASVVTPKSYLQYFPEQEQKIALTYRLLYLSPNSKTVPALLDYLKGEKTEAEFKRALQAARPAKKK